MRSPIAIALVAALAVGVGSLATGPAAAFTKDELVMKLMRGKGDKPAITPHNKSLLVIAPGGVKTKDTGVHNMLIVAPPSGIAAPGGSKKIAVHPMIVQPGGGIATIPAKSEPGRAAIVAGPGGIIAEPTNDQLRRLSQGKLLVEQRKQLAAIVTENDLPSVDMEVYFAWDSS